MRLKQNRNGDREEATRLYEEAAQAFQTALLATPRDPDLLRDAALVYIELGRYDDAVRAYKEACDLKPKEAELHSLLGNALVAYKNDFDRAVLEHRIAVKLQPTEARYHFNLGLALFYKNAFTGSTEELREAARLSPQEGIYHSHLAAALQAIGELDSAILEYRAALSLGLDRVLEPRTRCALRQLTHAKLQKYLDAGLYQEAEEASKQELKQDEFDAVVRLLYGRALAGEGRTDDGIGQLRAALKLAPDQWDALWYIATTHLKNYRDHGALRDRDQAVDYLEQLLAFKLTKQGSTASESARLAAAQQQAEKILVDLYSPAGLWLGHDERTYLIEKRADGSFWVEARGGDLGSFSLVHLTVVTRSTVAGPPQPGVIGGCITTTEYSGVFSESGTRLVIEGTLRAVSSALPKPSQDPREWEPANRACRTVLGPDIGKSLIELKLRRLQ